MAKRKTSKKTKRTPKQALILLVLCVVVGIVQWYLTPEPVTVDMDNIPEYAGEAYVVINDNQPSFTEEDWTTASYEYYSELDSLGRCGVTEACVGQDIMPTEERGEIGQVKPTGWQTVKYDVVDGKYLYNRCHLIGFQLTGENANKQNLITGTRYMNVDGMLPFENMVADYVQETGTMFSTGSRQLSRMTSWWLAASRWKRGAWKTRAMASASMSFAITSSLAWKSTTPPVRAIWRRMRRHDGADLGAV